MLTHIIEATQGLNHGKFLLARHDNEWQHTSHLGEVSTVPDGHERGSLLRRCGWTPRHLWVLDLQTGEGALFLPGGSASADLNDKHQIWVCPLYEPFLTWLYRQDLTDLSALPHIIALDPATAPAAFYGYRRTGRSGTEASTT